MSRLSASLVVDITDKTGGKTRAIIGNMDRLKRAERDYMLADRNVNLSRRDRAMERLMMEREADLERRRQRAARITGLVTTGAITAGYMAAKAYQNYAQLERRVNRIVINADKGADTIQPTIQKLQAIANATSSSFEEVVTGLEALVASGRTLEESLAFLPSVALTAQASGAAMNDVALSADALSGSLKISASDMQQAFDILVAGGKAGKFELKDMSQYLPSLLPAFAALGYKGNEGLQKIVAALQVVRNQTGSSSEAATNFGNILNKMYSEETAKKFKKFGIDLPAALAKAKKEGRDVLDVFLDMTMIATKGDLSKLTRLFTDAEYQKGVRALVTQREELEKLNAELGRVDGTTLKDFGQIAADSEAKLQRLSNLWSRFATQIGGQLVAPVANPILDNLTKTMDDIEAESRALAGMSGREREMQTSEFFRRYRELHPGAFGREVNGALGEARRAVGRGEARSVFDGLSAEEGRRRGGDVAGRYPSRGSYGAFSAGQGLGAGPADGRIPIPGSRPAMTATENAGRERAGYYPTQGDYSGRSAEASPYEALAPLAGDLIDLDGLVRAGATASDSIAEGGDKAAKTMQASAGAIGSAIAEGFLGKVRAALPSIITNAGGGRPTGQVVREQMNGAMATGP